MQADRALAQFPDARIGRSRLPLPFGLAAGLMKVLVTLTRGRFLPPGFAGSMGAEDPRRPRLEMGLGVWTDRVSRYYPLETLKAGDGVLLDVIDNRKLLIYLDPVSRHAYAPLRRRAGGRMGRQRPAPGRRAGHSRRKTLRFCRRRVADRTAFAPLCPLVRIFVDLSELRDIRRCGRRKRMRAASTSTQVAQADLARQHL